MNIVQPLSWKDIQERSRPSSPEGVPWWLYDTQTYTDNTSTTLTYFTATNSDESLTNLASGGVLPADQALFIHNVYIDYFLAAGTAWASVNAAGVVTGHLNDIGMLHMAARGRFLLKIRSKDYGPWPICAFQGLGGVTGGVNGTQAAGVAIEYGHNAQGVGSGRGALGGGIVIPPQTSFSVRLQWPAAVDLTADFRIRVTLHGALYRNIQ